MTGRLLPVSAEVRALERKVAFLERLAKTGVPAGMKAEYERELGIVRDRMRLLGERLALLEQAGGAS